MHAGTHREADTDRQTDGHAGMFSQQAAGDEWG